MAVQPPATAGGSDNRGTASAEKQDGKHEMERAPAAITSLTLHAAAPAARRAILQSNPPEKRARSEMTGLPAFRAQSNNLVCTTIPSQSQGFLQEVCQPDLQVAWVFWKSVKTTEIVTLTVPHFVNWAPNGALVTS